MEIFIKVLDVIAVLVAVSFNLAAVWFTFEGYESYKTKKFDRAVVQFLMAIAFATLFDFKIN